MAQWMVQESAPTQPGHMGAGAAGTAAGAAYTLLLYVLPLYASRALPRNHPRTVWRRMTTSLLTTACLAWVPLYYQMMAASGQVGAAVGLH